MSSEVPSSNSLASESLVRSDSLEGEVENPEVKNRESQLLSYIREIPVKGFKACDLTRITQTYKRAK